MSVIADRVLPLVNTRNTAPPTMTITITAKSSVFIFSIPNGVAISGPLGAEFDDAARPTAIERRG
ncbi:hypothetical protein NB231_03025 [Nitrococcus mobilis Nb-231]|uniref:Uncharacterized protein n=1 Tax=Nitrococcus mobilis Nb-231 TaxID=314278 RepID=A4BVE6_9GAMM|nr:hypothetical protein NB231_03025 [Nitrococcus mobilis Nb-231]